MKRTLLFLIMIFCSLFLIDNVFALSIARVTYGDGATIRSGPGGDYTSLGTLKYNDNVPLLNTSLFESKSGCSDGWYQVDYNGSVGFVCSKNVSTSKVTVKVDYEEGINVRNGAGTDNSVYTEFNNNKLVTLYTTSKYEGVGCSDKWYRINYNSYIDKYICSTYVKNYNSKSNIIVTSSSANIKKNPSKDGEVVDTLKYNQSLTLYDKTLYESDDCSGGYYRVYYKGYNGRYICSNYVLNTNYNGIVTNKNGVNIRVDATSKSDKRVLLKVGSFISLYDNKKIEGTGCDSGWYKIKYHGKDGYICSNYVSTSALTTKIINTEKLNVRNGASSKEDLVTTLNKNTRVSLVSSTKVKDKSGCSSGWYKININNKVGYVCSKYTELSKYSLVDNNADTSSKTITTKSTSSGNYYLINKWTYRINENYAYARSGPSTSYSVKDILYLGTELDYISLSDNWYKVKYYNGKIGYVHKNYVDKYSSVTKTDSDYCKTLTDKGFPSSYCPYLSYLHSKYPKWVFTPEKTGVSFTGAINGESGKNYTQNDYAAYLKSSSIAEAGGWRVANAGYIAFMIDPRNYLNEKNIFAFEHLNYNDSLPYDDIVKNIFSGSWLANDTYASAFTKAGYDQKVSPSVLAARSKQEGATDKTYAAVSGNVSTTWNTGVSGYICSTNTTKSSSKVSVKDGYSLNVRKGAGTDYSNYSFANGKDITVNSKDTLTLANSYAYNRKVNSSDGVIVRSKASSSYEKLGSLSNKTAIGLVDSNKYNGIIDSGSSINVRKEANSSSKKLGSVSSGSSISIINKEKVTGEGCSSGWYKINYGSSSGYICSSYVKSSNGCSSGWYKINYNSGTGYVCSSYVTSLKGCSSWYKVKVSKSLKGIYNFYNIGSYGSNPVIRGLAAAAGYVDYNNNTPWNTRTKAITYGASFVANEYIHAGQYTLYYQKFNVSPENSSKYTHQYMTNILAPASEGLSSYRSYDNLDLLNKKFVFKIPVYNSMPSQITTHPVVK